MNNQRPAIVTKVEGTFQCLSVNRIKKKNYSYKYGKWYDITTKKEQK